MSQISCTVFLRTAAQSWSNRSNPGAPCRSGQDASWDIELRSCQACHWGKGASLLRTQSLPGRLDRSACWLGCRRGSSKPIPPPLNDGKTLARRGGRQARGSLLAGWRRKRLSLTGAARSRAPHFWTTMRSLKSATGRSSESAASPSQRTNRQTLLYRG